MPIYPRVLSSRWHNVTRSLYKLHPKSQRFHLLVDKIVVDHILVCFCERFYYTLHQFLNMLSISKYAITYKTSLITEREEIWKSVLFYQKKNNRYDTGDFFFFKNSIVRKTIVIEQNNTRLLRLLLIIE